MIDDYLGQLEQDRDDFVSNLETKGITGLIGDETFTELVPKVLDIAGGGTTMINEVKSFNGMFKGNTSVQELDLSCFGACPCTNFEEMFYNCTSLTRVNLKNLKSTENSFAVNYMFRGTTGLTAMQFIDLRSFEFSTNSLNLSDMFGTNYRFGIPNNCVIVVKDATEKAYFNTNLSRLTNVMTADEYEAS